MNPILLVNCSDALRRTLKAKVPDHQPGTTFVVAESIQEVEAITNIDYFRAVVVSNHGPTAATQGWWQPSSPQRASGSPSTSLSSASGICATSSSSRRPGVTSSYRPPTNCFRTGCTSTCPAPNTARTAPTKPARRRHATPGGPLHLKTTIEYRSCSFRANIDKHHETYLLV